MGQANSPTQPPSSVWELIWTTPSTGPCLWCPIPPKPPNTRPSIACCSYYHSMFLGSQSKPNHQKRNHNKNSCQSYIEEHPTINSIFAKYNVLAPMFCPQLLIPMSILIPRLPNPAIVSPIPKSSLPQPHLSTSSWIVENLIHAFSLPEMNYFVKLMRNVSQILDFHKFMGSPRFQCFFRSTKD